MRRKRITRDQAITEIINVFTYHLACGKTSMEADDNFWNDKTNEQLLEVLHSMYLNVFEILPVNDATKILYGDKK